MEGIIVIIIFCLIGVFSFLHSKNVNKNAVKGNLPPTEVVYLNGCLNYQSGVDVKIKANPNQITVDEKYHIPVQKILEAKVIQTKQLTEQQKNIIGRTALGFLIAGGIGGVIGSISGIGSSKKTEDMEILYITYKDIKDVEQTMSFVWKSIDEKSVVLNSWVSSFTKGN